MGERRGEGQKAEGREEMDRAEEGSRNDPQSAIRHTSDTARSIAQLRLRCIAQIAQIAGGSECRGRLREGHSAVAPVRALVSPVLCVCDWLLL